MPKLKVIRDRLLLAYADGDVNDEEFCILYDINASTNLDLPYWTYERFNLENMSDDESVSELRFYPGDIYKMIELFGFPEVFTCYNGVVCDSVEAFCLLLKRFAYPCRYQDLMSRFGRPVPQLCMISNQVLNFLHLNWAHLLSNFQQNWLSPQNLEAFAQSIHQKGAPLDNCWGFVDGTVRPICRPSHNQRIVYNGHKKVHSLKFQSVVAPNGMIANMYGPVEGKRHDSGMLADSGLLNQLQQHSYGQNGRALCIYGDPAYPLRVHLQSGFKGANITQQQMLWNKAMSEARVSVEWIFGDIINYFKFLDFKKNLKLELSAIGKMYLVCALLHNARCCLYKNTTTKQFDLDPPILEDYLV